MAFRRLAGLAALGFVLIVVAVNVVLQAGNPPVAGAGEAEVVRYFTEQALAVRLGVVLAGPAWLLIAVFGAGAFLRIHRVERDRGEAWSTVGLLGTGALIVMFGAVTATRLALVAAPGIGLWHLHNALFTVNNLTLVVVLVGFSIGGLRTAALHRWHGSVGLLGAVLLAAAAVIGVFTAGGGPAGLSAIGLAGFALWLVWLGGFGIRQLITP